jgi:Ca2+-binding EF-hand superfamily protein
MYLSLGKKRVGSTGNRKVTVQESKQQSGGSSSSPNAQSQSQQQPPPPPPTPPLTSPYSLYFPANVLNKITLVEDANNPALGTDFSLRCVDRIKKRSYFQQNASAFAGFKSGNLAAVHRAFVQVVASDGTLTKDTYSSALTSLGVINEDLIDRTFALFDVRKHNIVEYIEVISALDVIINGVNSHITCTDCFNILDPAGCGYLIRNCLREIKILRLEENGINHLMIKTLIEIIDRLKDEDAQRYSKMMAKKNKKKKKKPQDKKNNLFTTTTPSQSNASAIVSRGVKGLLDAAKRKVIGAQQFQPKIHLSFDEFSQCMSTDPVLVQSFLSRILLTIEVVYLRNKNATITPATTSASAP